MRYEKAPDLMEKIEDLAKTLNLDYVNTNKIACFRSYGTNSRRVIARCHGLPKVMQLGMNVEPFYVIEVISERFNKMNEEEQMKVLLHELLHIPRSFGGGFRQHDFVNRRTVEKLYFEYKKRKNINSNGLVDKISINTDNNMKKETDNGEFNKNPEEINKNGLIEKINRLIINRNGEGKNE